MLTLGINAAYHDCSAALVRDGVPVAASEEERFTRIKHGKRPVPFTTWQLPFHAIDDCLAQAGAVLADVDRFAYAYDPSLLTDATAADAATIALPLEPSAHGAPGSAPWEPLFRAYLVNAPRQLAGGAPHHLQRRLGGVPPERIRARWQYVEHHLAHEASAFLACEAEDTAVITMDGRGERATTSLGVFEGGRHRRLHQVDLPHSLGLLYEALTQYLGFLHSADEYKVMALASYGGPAHVAAFREILKPDGEGGYTVQPPRLVERFGPPRERGGPLLPLHFDLAHSLQKVLEDTVLSMAHWLHARCGLPALAMAGGVALNCVMNARIRDEGPFREVWVQPAAGDAGTALGAALWVDREARGERGGHWRMRHALLGPAYDEATIAAALDFAQLPYRRVDDIAGETARLLADERIVGWFQGGMEFGPRALGGRSILASPRDPAMQQRLNAIKDREDFRPVAPVVPEERVADWFETGRGQAADPAALVSPFMLFVHRVRSDRADRIPAVRHVDGTARVQTVRADQDARLHRLLNAFGALTGVPVLVNTSFNTRGEPIVRTPRDALECFWTSPLDALAIGPFLVEKPR